MGHVIAIKDLSINATFIRSDKIYRVTKKLAGKVEAKQLWSPALTHIDENAKVGINYDPNGKSTWAERELEI